MVHSSKFTTWRWIRLEGVNREKYIGNRTLKHIAALRKRARGRDWKGLPLLTKRPRATWHEKTALIVYIIPFSYINRCKLKNVLKLCLILFISFYTRINKRVIILNSKIEQKVKQLCQDSPPFNDLKNHSFVFLPRMWMYFKLCNYLRCSVHLVILAAHLVISSCLLQRKRKTRKAWWDQKEVW